MSSALNSTTLTPAARTTAAAATISQSHLDSTRITFLVDPDILLACEDQARSQRIPLQEWFQQTINDSLRGMLGI